MMAFIFIDMGTIIWTHVRPQHIFEVEWSYKWMIYYFLEIKYIILFWETGRGFTKSLHVIQIA